MWLGPSWLRSNYVCQPEVKAVADGFCSDIAVLDLDSPFLRSLARRNKRRQGWSLSKLITAPRPRPAPPLHIHCHADPTSVAPTSVPKSSDIPKSSQTFLSSFDLVPCENFATSHCWWASAAMHAKKHIIDLMLNVLDHAQASQGMPPELARTLLSPVTSTRQIAAAIPALRQDFPSGLLIVHGPGNGAYFFHPDLAYKFMPFSSASKWREAFPTTPIMLFTQDPRASIGHYQLCVPSSSAASCGQAFASVVEKVCPAINPDMKGASFAQPLRSTCIPIDLSADGEDVEFVLCDFASVGEHAGLDLHTNNDFRGFAQLPVLPSNSPSVRVVVDLDSDSCGTAHESELASPVPGSLTPLPWQPSPNQVCSPAPETEADSPPSSVAQPCFMSPTIPFTVDCFAPATWLDPLHPSPASPIRCSQPVSSFSQDRVIQETSARCVDASTRPSQEVPSLGSPHVTQAAECEACRSFNLSTCLCLCQQSWSRPPSSLAQDRAIEETSARSSVACTRPSREMPSSGCSLVTQATECEACRSFSLSTCLCLHHQSPLGTRQRERPSRRRFVCDGCSCVGMFGVCLCGYVHRAEQALKERSSSTGEQSPSRNETSLSLDGPLARQNEPTPSMDGASFSLASGLQGCIDLDAESCSEEMDFGCSQAHQVQRQCPVPISMQVAKQAVQRFPDDLPRAIAESCRLACSPTRQRSRSPVPYPIMNLPTSVPALPLRERIGNFWRARHDILESTVATLYSQHLRADASDASALAGLFHALPCDWPVQLDHFDLSVDVLFDDEVELWRQRATDSLHFEGTIQDAWNSQLHLAKLLPFFLAVLCLFAEKAGIAREFPFGFALLMAPWLCHRSLHVCFNPLKPEHEVRARLFIALVAESNCGKSPFFRQVVDAVFVTHDPARPCLVDLFPDCFVVPGPGKDKTLFVQQCTNSDFARRMKATQGHLCWLSEEAWSALDVAWARGKGRVSQTERKVQHCFLQNTQNGNSYGPMSINSEQFFVPTTNFAFFHAGQPKVIHDYWGQAFLKDCPFGGMGWEFRPTYLWPRDQPEHDESMPHVTFAGATRFLLDIFARLCTCYGQTLDSKGFSSSPIPVTRQAAAMWSKFRHQAERDKGAVPPCAAGAVGKHCFTTTSHITACHLLQEAFLDIKQGKVDLDSLRKPTPACSALASSAPWPQSIRPVPAELMLAAPEHLHLMLTGILTCFNEMKLAQHERAGPPVLEEERLCSGRRRVPQPAPNAGTPQSTDENALSLLLQRFQDRSHISVTDANIVLPRRLGFRSDQQGICRLFDLAAQHHAGVREGNPNAGLRLRLTLANIDAAFRKHLNLQLSSPCAIGPAEEPAMAGAGKRGCKQRQQRPNLEAVDEAGDDEEKPQECKKKLEKKELVTPVYVPAEPLTSKEVEDALNAALQAQHEHVHGQPFKVKATSVKRNKGKAFQLRCAICQHHTCTWRGMATCKTGEFMVHSSYMLKGEHGQIKTPKAKSGRKVGQTANTAFTVTETLAYTGGLDQKSIWRVIEKHFENKRLQDTLLVRCHPRKATKKGPTCIFECKTHFHRATESPCPWGGAARITTLEDGSYQLHLRYHSSEAHAPDEVRLYGTLTWRQRQAAKRCEKLDTPSLSAAVDNVRDRANPHLPIPPLKRPSLFQFIRRTRLKLGAQAKEAPACRKSSHSCSDFEFCRDRCNASLQQAENQLLPDSPALLPADAHVRVVDMHLSPKQVCVPMVCPQLLALTLSLLPKPWNLKLSTDGTYRLLFDSYTFLTMGVNVKNWSARKDLNIFSFRSSFVPLCFALANKENDEAYSHMSSTLFKTAQNLGHDLQAHHVLQWHGDMHLGIEAARRRVAPNSTRLSDWAHVTGATSQGPSGLSGLLVKELPGEVKESVLPWILQYCRISKQWPALLFHVVWEAIFAELDGLCEASAITKLQRQYFMWQQDVERWDAPWRSAPDRIMPGTDAGSAPQESWHNSILKPAFGNIPRKPADVARILEERVVSPQIQTLRAMEHHGEAFQDWPSIGMFLDQHILAGDVQLQKEGRTSGKTLLAWRQHQRWQDRNGNIWMLVPTSKFKTDWSQSTGKKKVYKPRSPLSLNPGAVKHYAALITAASVDDVREALSSLDLYDNEAKSFKCWRRTAKALDDWRCVVSGPFVDSFWREYHDELPAVENKHRLWLCYGCHYASLWGPCEHAYCCMEHEGQSSVTTLPKPKPKGRPSTKAKLIASRASTPQIIPANVHAEGASSSIPGLSSSDPVNISSSPDNQELRALLRSASLGQFYQLMLEQGVTTTALRRCSMSDLVTLFRMTIGEANSLMEALDSPPAVNASVAWFGCSSKAMPCETFQYGEAFLLSYPASLCLLLLRLLRSTAQVQCRQATSESAAKAPLRNVSVPERRGKHVSFSILATCAVAFQTRGEDGGSRWML